jgi:hypothetical protein
MEMRHELKTWPEFYRAIQDNKKTFELRYDDRRYAVGDELLLREFEPCNTCKGKGKVWVDLPTPQYFEACRDGTLEEKREPDCPDCLGSGGRYTSFSMLYSVTYILRDHPGIRGGYVIMGLYNLASGDAFV